MISAASVPTRATSSAAAAMSTPTLSPQPPPIQYFSLGAGQDVGRSCVLVQINHCTVLFDCGLHMAPKKHDNYRFPHFHKLFEYFNVDPATTTLNDLIDVVVVTHFHLDHCGGVPYLTEYMQYTNDIYMTGPTLAITPLLLHDYIKVARHKQDTTDDKILYTHEQIKSAMSKIKTIAMSSTVSVQSQCSVRSNVTTVPYSINVTAYEAGHVIGASVFHVSVGTQSVLYTGDYNTEPDHHLTAAHFPLHLQPDLLITESTYATTIRNTTASDRDQAFLQPIVDCVLRGGKALIPIFAIGRTQELCLLLDSYWRAHSTECKSIPIYFSAGITTQSNSVYSHYLSYLNNDIQESYLHDGVDAFSFPCIQPYTDSVIESEGPCVVLATPGMLLSGLSLEVFSRWAPDEKNMVVLPGYCQPGSAGNKVLAGQKRIKADLRGREIEFDCNCQVSHMSFSAHADANGIMSYIRAIEPRNVVLVHGEREKMPLLCDRIETELKIPAYCPPNYQELVFDNTSTTIPARIDVKLIEQTVNDPYSSLLYLHQQHGKRQHQQQVERELALQQQRKKQKVVEELEEGEASDDEPEAEQQLPLALQYEAQMMQNEIAHLTNQNSTDNAYLLRATISVKNGFVDVT